MSLKILPYPIAPSSTRGDCPDGPFRRSPLLATSVAKAPDRSSDGMYRRLSR